MSEIPPDPNTAGPPCEPPGDLPDAWQVVFEQSAAGLRAFLRTRLSQSSDVDDCLQAVFVRMLERGSDVAPAARRAWLFRVAANESAGFWRGQSSTKKMISGQMILGHNGHQIDPSDPAESLIHHELTEHLQAALAALPETYRDVVRLRIHENLTFQAIADHLRIPLGTALTRMQRALKQLRAELDSDDS